MAFLANEQRGGGDSGGGGVLGAERERELMESAANLAREGWAAELTVKQGRWWLFS
jgi:hypothetical protein